MWSLKTETMTAFVGEDEFSAKKDVVDYNIRQDDVKT